MWEKENFQERENIFRKENAFRERKYFLKKEHRIKGIIQAIMTTKEFKKLPKIELHCHLDGSLSREFIEERLGRSVEETEIRVSKDCRNLEEYLGKFVLPIACLQDQAGLTGAGYDVLRTMGGENVCYAEVRFDPVACGSKGMSTEQAIEALLKGLEKGKQDFGVEYNVIVCAMRHYSEERNYEMIRTARQFLGAGVCAADLAGAEAQYPMSAFRELFRKVRKLGMPFTIHAGECGNADNIAEAIKAGAKRIGHGIAMGGKSGIQELVKKAGVGIEMCPISNLQTKAVSCPEEYPLREFLDKGLFVTINTDNRAVSGTSLTKELEFIAETYGIGDEEVLLCMRNAAEVSFTDEHGKERILKTIRNI